MQLNKNLELATATRYQHKFFEDDPYLIFNDILFSLILFYLFILLFLMELELGNAVLKVGFLLCCNVSERFSP